MYLHNKYSRVYFKIIEKAKIRILDSYTESHHIIPKSLGGSNSKENLVNLSAREHFICHWLLTKMTVGIAKAKMLNAVFMMATNANPSQKRYKIGARKYEVIRTAWASREVSKETRLKIGEASKGRAQSLAARRKNSESNSGKNNGMFGRTHTEESRKRISDAAKRRPKVGKGNGKPMPPEIKEKIRGSIKRQYQEKRDLRPDF